MVLVKPLSCLVKPLPCLCNKKEDAPYTVIWTYNAYIDTLFWQLFIAAYQALNSVTCSWPLNNCNVSPSICEFIMDYLYIHIPAFFV